MRENRLRTLWQADRAAINGWLAIPNSFSAEVMAHQGWDTVLQVDGQGVQIGRASCRERV